MDTYVLSSLRTLEKVLLQRILASFSGFSLPRHSSGFLDTAFGDGEICLVSEKRDYFAKMRFATHPMSTLGSMNLRTLKWILRLLVLAVPFTAQGTIYYVSKAGTPEGPGLSWASAFDHFITALAWAQPEDTLFIGEGIYLLPQNERVFISKGIRMFGGFAGWESAPEERLAGVHSTTIRSMGYYSKLVLDSLYVPSILDGLIFRDGNSYECGFNCNEPCYFTTSECWGGILYVRTSPKNGWRDLLIQDCVFEKNRANHGGAVAIDNYGGSKSHIRFKRCLFKDNVSGIYGMGGAILYRSQSSAHTAILIVDSCTFRGNNTYYHGGGGVYLETHDAGIDSIVISNSIFENGTSWSAGGCGIRLDNRTIHPLENLLVYRCIFRGNVNYVPNKASWIGGSAMHLRNGGQVTECLFLGNRGVWSPVLAGYSMNVQNCLFANNRTSKGNATILTVGEWQNYGFTPFSNKFSNCTFVNNTADTILPLIYRSYPLCQDTLVNCVMYGNRDEKQSPVVVDKWADFSTLFVAGMGGDVHPESFYFVLEDGNTDFSTLMDTWWGGDPLFVDTAALDFRLKRCSPFINVGLNAFVTAPFDMDGNLRILEGRVDLGAYERRRFKPELDVLPALCAHAPDGLLLYGEKGITPPAQWTITDTQGMFWENGMLNRGIYTVSLLDAEDCSQVFAVEVEGPDTIIARFNVQSASPGLGNGSIRIDSLFGGESAYDITWYDGSKGMVVTGLEAGHYTVSIRDALECTRVWAIEVPLQSAVDRLDPMGRFSLVNPSSGALVYTWTPTVQSDPLRYAIVDLAGQLVRQGTLHPGQHMEPLPGILPGYYRLMLQSEGIRLSYPLIFMP